jgi:hypothetical protein
MWDPSALRCTGSPAAGGFLIPVCIPLVTEYRALLCRADGRTELRGGTDWSVRADLTREWRPPTYTWPRISR